MISLDYRTIPIEEISLNPREAANRLKVSTDFRSPEIEKCFLRLKEVASCKFVAARAPLIRFDKNRLDCGFGELESATLIKNLKDSREAFVFAVTIGLGVDRLLARLSAVSQAEHFITDALASALAEAATNKAEELIKNGTLCRPRFSPGFGDLSIELQPRLLGMLNAQRLLGITVNSSYLMSPMKSVTAIMGVLPSNDSE